MEHDQTVARPHNGTPGCWATVWSVSTNFLISNSILKQQQIFKISYFHQFYQSFEKNYFSPNITKNQQKISKTTQNIDM